MCWRMVRLLSRLLAFWISRYSTPAFCSVACYSDGNPLLNCHVWLPLALRSRSLSNTLMYFSSPLLWLERNCLSTFACLIFFRYMVLFDWLLPFTHTIFPFWSTSASLYTIRLCAVLLVPLGSWWYVCFLTVIIVFGVLFRLSTSISLSYVDDVL